MLTGGDQSTSWLCAPRAGSPARAFAVMLAVAVGGCASLALPAPELPLPNRVDIDARLVTAGQPSRAQLVHLKRAGFGAIAQIASISAPDGVDDEAALVGAQACTTCASPSIRTP